MHPTTSNGLAAANNQPAEKYNLSTDKLDFAIGTKRSKAETSLIARLALAGHSVYPLHDGGYLVSKWNYTFHAGDIDELQAFAVRLGLSQ
jgi:hypothetical protein